MSERPFLSLGDCTEICGEDRESLPWTDPGDCPSCNMLIFAESTGLYGLKDNVNVCPTSDASGKL